MDKSTMVGVAVLVLFVGLLGLAIFDAVKIWKWQTPWSRPLLAGWILWIGSSFYRALVVAPEKYFLAAFDSTDWPVWLETLARGVFLPAVIGAIVRWGYKGFVASQIPMEPGGQAHSTASSANDQNLRR